MFFIGGIVFNMNKRMSDLPEDERPYEKCFKYGPSVLSDAELLAVIIRTGAKGEQSLELARKILQLSKSCNGLLGLYHSTIEELMQIKGIGKVKAVQLKCITELAKRYRQASVKETFSFEEPAGVAEYYMEQLRHEEQEKTLLLMLNTKSKLIKEKILSVGTVNASLISPREVFVEALKCSAVNIILLHNHPSGDATPSFDDIKITNRIRRSGEILGIKLLDHIIIGDNTYTSFLESNILCDLEGEE